MCRSDAPRSIMIVSRSCIVAAMAYLSSSRGVPSPASGPALSSMRPIRGPGVMLDLCHSSPDEAPGRLFGVEGWPPGFGRGGGAGARGAAIGSTTAPRTQAPGGAARLLDAAQPLQGLAEGFVGLVL